MKDYMFVPAKNQATIAPWYMRCGKLIAEVLFVSCSTFWLVVFALIVGLR